MDRAAWDARYGTGLVWGTGPNALFAAQAEALPPGRALDVACGEGRNAVWLAARGWEVTAVDFSAVALDRGRELAAAAGVSVDWLAEDVVAHRPPRAAFDLVAIVFLQIPSGDYAAVLERSAAAVAPGGTMLVIAHDRDNLENGHGGPRDPDVLTTPEAVVAALADLRVERAERFMRPVEGAPRAAVDTFVRAVRPAA